ncbi:MAG: sulfite exporter TauE/SafE family protein [Sphingomonadales bacterium]|nr:sulfite exporter TauE/SafE family protein [Sphingomonadales bacterium]
MITALAISLTTAQLIGFAASLLIGLSLGLIGGGGSILTVPVLVYLLGVEPVLATAYSLFIVGFTSAVGVYPKYKEGLVDVRTALIFGAPSIAAVFLTRKMIVPNIPTNILQFGDWVLTKSVLLMILFAVLMVAASVSMIRDKKNNTESSEGALSYNYPLIVLEGALVGLLTGLVGAGGGFLIIPALVMLTKLPMKKAVGTSLLIIAAKSLIGFTGDLSQQSMDWSLLLVVTLMAVLGIFAGNALSKKIEGAQLKKGFGWFVLVMGVYVLVKEALGSRQ